MKRLKALDGLRVVAILMVMCFHYYYMFNNSIYELNGCYDFFQYGYLGVQLFFIISGFVISLTLTKTDTFMNFLKKRWIRLFPGMLICSLLTFSIIHVFDTENLFPESKKLINLIVSNTFISPALINPIFNVNTSFIDPPYWSLWVEIQFYILAGMLYFVNKRKFISHFVIVAVILSSVFYISHNFSFLPERLEWFFRVITEIFNLSQHAIWFALGTLIYKLYFEGKNRLILFVIFLLMLMQWVFVNLDLHYFVFLLCCGVIFYCFLYHQKLLNFLTQAQIQKIGIASYSIYLIHQNLGGLIIEKYADDFGRYSFFLPIIVMVVFGYIGVMIYNYFEKPIGTLIKNKIVR